MENAIVTTLITSFATLLAVGISHLISEYRNFMHQKNAIIDEIDLNYDLLKKWNHQSIL